MIMGTWFTAWGGVLYGPWYGILFGLAGGALFGLIHAVATVSFQVDHIVSGVAINILAARSSKIFKSLLLLMIIAFASSTASPIVEGEIGRITLPFISGGEINGSPTFNILGSLEEQNIILLSDIAGLLYGVTSNISYFSIFLP